MPPQGRRDAVRREQGVTAGARRETHQAPPAGGRLDQVLVGLLPEQSRSRVQHWIRDGHVSIAGTMVTRPSLRLQGGETIVVDLPPASPTELHPESIALDVIYEDDDLLVVNKAAGMVVHPSAGHESGTLVHAVLGHAPDLAGVGGEIRPGIVHRLDRHTSGLIVVAKNDLSLRALQDQFRLKSVEKVYLALVDGQPPTRHGRVEAPIGRDPRRRKRMSVLPEGKGREAITEYWVRESLPAHALLEAHPKTGRTHQIRVHLAFLGCPVAGDRVYGLRKPTLDLPRQMLHAWRLRFRLPGETTVERAFEAPVPEDMLQAIEWARGHATPESGR